MEGDDSEIRSDDGEEGDGPGFMTAMHWRTGSPAPFAALQYPLLRTRDDHLQTRTEATLNLLTNLFGVGLLTIPHALSRAGLISGLALMAFVGYISRYTLILIIEMSSSALDLPSYPEIGKRAFGQQGLLATLLMYLLYCGGILVAYLIALADIIQQIGPFFSNMPRFVVFVVAAAVCAPGAAMKSLKHHSTLSAACMLGVMALVLALLVVCLTDEFSPTLVNPPIDSPHRHGDVDLFRVDLRGWFAAMCLFGLHFSVHAGATEVLSQIAREDEEEVAEAEGEEVSAIPMAESISRIAFFIAFLICALVGALGYLRFGDRVAGNFLMNFDQSVPHTALALARIVYGLVLVCSFAFMIVPLRFTVLDVFALRQRGQDVGVITSRAFHKATAGIIGVCASMAWMISDLASLLEFVGMWATMALGFAFPSIFLMELRRRQEQMPIVSMRNLVSLLLFAFGVAVAIGGTCDVLFGASEGRAGYKGERIIIRDPKDSLDPKSIND